jgi:hypothetical protein
MKASNSSINSGTGSGGVFGAAAETAGGGARVVPSDEGGVAADCVREVVACGSSMVDVAMSSSRAVAASSLAGGSVRQRIAMISDNSKL